MKNDLTTGTWQDDIWRPINMILFALLMYLAQILGYMVICWVDMMSLCHVWGWQPPQTASCIIIRHVQRVWAHWYAVHGYTVAALHSNTHTTYLAHILGFLVTFGVKMLSVHHGWGCQPPQTASHIHIRHVQSVWAHWCAVHGHTIAALHSHTHASRLSFWVLGHLWSQNVVITSWLGLTATSNCFWHPNET